VEQLGRYYRDSPKRVAILERFQQQELSRNVKIVQSAFTRYLTHDMVTASVHQSLVPCLLELKESSKTDATSLGLFSMMIKYEFVGLL
jgi:hypothetical protein